MNLGDQGTGRIEDGQAAGGGLFLDAAGYAVGAENGYRQRRNLRKVLDEDRPLGFEAFDHVLVMYDLVPDIDRRTILLKRAFNDFDGTDDARTKSAGLR
jgi:hypothetical protein